MNGFKMEKIDTALSGTGAQTSSILFPFGTPPFFGNIVHSPCDVYRGSGFFKLLENKGG